MKNKPYPKYKPSGVEWLGDVPEHWGVKKLKNQVTINDETLPETTDPDYEMLYVDISSVDPAQGIIQKEGLIFENAPSRARRIVRDGDTIVSTVRTYLRAIAPVIEPEKNLTVSTGFAVIRPRKIDKDYLSATIRAPYFIEEVVSRSVGASYPAINASEIGFIAVPLPPLPEQQAIGAFLDRETGRIDALIAKKQRLLELLAEQRTALISRAVTKGLDASVKLKPSGVEWLGDVPEHWEVKALKHVVYLKSGDGITIEEIEEEGEYPVYGGNGFRGFSNKFTHEGEFVLIGRQGALCGNINYAKGKFWASEHAIVANPSKPIATSWLGELLRIMNLNQYSVSAAQPGLAIDRIKELYLPVPPLPEQQAIAAFLDRETTKIDMLSAKVTTLIERLKEYRTALISSAVTGKIDVREAV
ncbi:restriction endonuclease subunit S [Treponema sp.]